jgi:hypothetical protein
MSDKQVVIEHRACAVGFEVSSGWELHQNEFKQAIRNIERGPINLPVLLSLLERTAYFMEWLDQKRVMRIGPGYTFGALRCDECKCYEYHAITCTVMWAQQQAPSPFPTDAEIAAFVPTPSPVLRALKVNPLRA